MRWYRQWRFRRHLKKNSTAIQPETPSRHDQADQAETED